MSAETKQQPQWICVACGGSPTGTLSQTWIEIKTGGKYSELRYAHCETCGDTKNFQRKEEK